VERADAAREVRGGGRAVGARRVVEPQRRELDGELGARRRKREGAAVAAAGALRLGSAVGAALGGRRVLGPADGDALAWAGVALLGAALLAALFPRAVLVPILVVQVWFGATLVAQAVRMRRRARRAGRREGGG
jgi:hypothetical protein